MKTTKSNVHVERTIPATQLVTIQAGDIMGIDMIALRPKTNMDVSLMVKVKKDSIKNIKAKLFCGDSDSPIHTVKMDNQKFYIFPSIPILLHHCGGKFQLIRGSRLGKSTLLQINH